MTSQSHFMISFLSIYDITATAFMTSDPLHGTSPPGFMTSRPLSLWHHRHYLCEYISTIFNIKHTVQRQYNQYNLSHNLHIVSLWSHTLYRWYNTHCIYDMAPSIFMAHYALYMTSHPRFMTSQHSIHYIRWLYLISNWLYLTALPLYLCHHIQIINHITPIVHIITQAQYIWYYMNTYGITFLFMISHHGMTFTHTVFMSSHPGFL